MSTHFQRTSTLKSCYDNDPVNKKKNDLVLMKPTYESTRLVERDRNENEDENKNDALAEFVRNLHLERQYTNKLNADTFIHDLVSNDYPVKINYLNKCLDIHKSDKNQLKIKRKSFITNQLLLRNKRLQQGAKNENRVQAEEGETNDNTDPAEQDDTSDTDENRYINMNGRNNNHHHKRKKTAKKILSALEHQEAKSAENNQMMLHMMTEMNKNISTLVRVQKNVNKQLENINKVLRTIAQAVTEE